MKYIEYPELAQLAHALAHEGPECSVHTRIEAYSCKNINRDKKLFRDLESAYIDDAANSPPIPSFLANHLDNLGLSDTPFGPMDKHQSRKTLYLLIATLNVAFPDHEFSDVRPQHFVKERESGASVLNALSTTLAAPSPYLSAPNPRPRSYSAYPPTSPDFFPSSHPTSSSPVNSYLPSPAALPQSVSGTHPVLYRLLDDIIGLAECDVYSYSPPIEADPHADSLSDSDDDGGDDADSESSPDDDEATFQFDDYDIDEYSSSRYRMRTSSGGIRIPFRSHSGDSYDSTLYPESDDNEDAGAARHLRRRRKGALLWSSHYFFHNRKMKRILFISVWAHAKSVPGVSVQPGRLSDLYDSGYASSSPEKTGGERFFGWEGGVGAGARALGLRG